MTGASEFEREWQKGHEERRRAVLMSGPDFCPWKPAPGWQLGQPCPECGHSDLVHVGTGHCPVCELVYQATPQFRRQQMRMHGMPAREMW